MCVIHVHEQSNTNNAEQACAHNLDTVVSDMDILERLADARGKHDLAATARKVKLMLAEGSDILWDDWQARINPEEPKTPRATIGNERYQAEHKHSDARVIHAQIGEPVPAFRSFPSSDESRKAGEPDL